MTATDDLQARLRQAEGERDRLQKESDTLHLRIYDAFTCPNCRGSKKEFPSVSASTDELVDCCICRGAGHVCFAELLDRFDCQQRKAMKAAEQPARADKLRESLEWYVANDDLNELPEAWRAARERAIKALEEGGGE